MHLGRRFQEQNKRSVKEWVLSTAWRRPDELFSDSRDSRGRLSGRSNHSFSKESYNMPIHHRSRPALRNSLSHVDDEPPLHVATPTFLSSIGLLELEMIVAFVGLLGVGIFYVLQIF